MNWQVFQAWLDGVGSPFVIPGPSGVLHGGVLLGHFCCWAEHRPRTLRLDRLPWLQPAAPHRAAQRQRLGRMFRAACGPLGVEGVTLAHEGEFSLTWNKGERTAGSLTRLLQTSVESCAEQLDARTLLIAPGVSDLALGARIEALEELRMPQLVWALDLDPDRVQLNINGRSMQGAELVPLLDLAIALSGQGLACVRCGCTEAWACDGGCSWAAPGPICTACVEAPPPLPAWQALQPPAGAA